jgi:uncharacterized repeat protein (TIGR01451 family)
VAGKQVTVDLPGAAPKTITRVQVSAALTQNTQNRFSALRQFRVDVSTNGTTFTPAFTSPADAFPSVPPRPVIPDMILRSFALPSPVSATHVRLVVLTNQCTGQPLFQGVQDADPLNPTDCRGQGEPPGTDPGGAAQLPPEQGTTVRVAEFQVFASGGGAVPNQADLQVTKVDSQDPVQRGQAFDYVITVKNNGPATATGVTVTDTLPKNAGFANATTTQGSCLAKPAKRIVTCNIGTMTALQTVTVTITVKATDQKPIVNCAQATAASPPEPSPDPSPNSDCETTTVTG